MPIVHVAGLPYDRATGALIRQLNQTPAPTDPYVRGIRVGPLGGVYMISGAAPVPPQVISAPIIYPPVLAGQIVNFNSAVVTNGALSSQQWLVNGVVVATAPSYTPLEVDGGKSLVYREAWDNGGGSVVTDSNAVTIQTDGLLVTENDDPFVTENSDFLTWA